MKTMKSEYQSPRVDFMEVTAVSVLLDGSPATAPTTISFSGQGSTIGGVNSGD